MIVGVLTWYEESARQLAAAVVSAGRFIDHLVAVDGAYCLFPDAKARSGQDQHDAIVSVCAGLGIGLTLHIPPRPWAGNEVEKRTRSLELAALVAGPDDWLFLFDADEVVSDVPDDLREALELAAAADYDVATCELWERHNEDDPAERWVAGASMSRNQVRKFYRALPGLRVEGLHYVYVAEKDGRKVWLWPPVDRADLAEPVLDGVGVRVEHRQRYRNRHRAGMAREYYHVRDTLDIEAPVFPDPVPA